MSHLHIADGILPWWLWIGAFAAALAIVAVALARLKRQRRLLPAVAVMAAVSLAVMNIPLGLPVHVNLAALAGIILGPLPGFLAMFVSNLFNALIGHGGLTVLGLNSLLVGSEALVAGALFSLLGREKRLLANVAVATVVALTASTLLMVATVGVAGQELAVIAAHGHHGPTAGAGFMQTFLALLALPLAIWLAAELSVSLLAVRYIHKIKGGWLGGGDRFESGDNR